jgi:predicted transcriptional regulator
MDAAMDAAMVMAGAGAGPPIAAPQRKSTASPAMLPLLNARQIKLLFETAAGVPEPATAQALRELAALRSLGLLEFDGGGRYEVTERGQERLASYQSALQPAIAALH